MTKEGVPRRMVVVGGVVRRKLGASMIIGVCMFRQFQNWDASNMILNHTINRVNQKHMFVLMP